MYKFVHLVKIKIFEFFGCNKWYHPENLKKILVKKYKFEKYQIKRLLCKKDPLIYPLHFQTLTIFFKLFANNNCKFTFKICKCHWQTKITF